MILMTLQEGRDFQEKSTTESPKGRQMSHTEVWSWIYIENQPMTLSVKSVAE